MNTAEGSNIMSDVLNEITRQMIETKLAIAEHNYHIKLLTKTKEMLELELVKILKEHKLNEIITADCHFGFKTLTRTSFDQSLFKEEHPQLFEKYYLTKEREILDFKS